MPKHNRNTRRKRNIKSRNLDTFKFNTTTQVTYTASGAANHQKIDALNLDPRIAVIAPEFELYRVVKLSVTVYPYTDTVTANLNSMFGICYKPYIQGDTALSTFADLSEVPVSMYTTESQSHPSRLIVPKSSLMTMPERWFATNAAATEVQSTQGYVHLAPRIAINTTVIVLRFTGIIQFKGPTYNTTDLKLLRSRELQEARDEIIALKKRIDLLSL